MNKIGKLLVGRYASKDRIDALTEKMGLIEKCYELNGKGYYIPRRDEDVMELVNLGLVKESVETGSYMSAVGMDFGIFCYSPVKGKK